MVTFMAAIHYYSNQESRRVRPTAARAMRRTRMKEGMGRLPGAGGAPSGGLSPATLPLLRGSAPARSMLFSLISGALGNLKTKAKLTTALVVIVLHSTKHYRSRPARMMLRLARATPCSTLQHEDTTKRRMSQMHEAGLGAPGTSCGPALRRSSLGPVPGAQVTGCCWERFSRTLPGMMAPRSPRHLWDKEGQVISKDVSRDRERLLTDVYTYERCSLRQARWVGAAGPYLPCRSLPPGKTSSNRTSHASS